MFYRTCPNVAFACTQLCIHFSLPRGIGPDIRHPLTAAAMQWLPELGVTVIVTPRFAASPSATTSSPILTRDRDVPSQPQGVAVPPPVCSCLPPLGAGAGVPATGGACLPTLSGSSDAGVERNMPRVGTSTPAPGGVTSLPALSGSAGAGVKRKAPATSRDNREDDISAWRANAYDDLPRIGSLYGQDLVTCPPHWQNEQEAREYLKRKEIRVPTHDGGSVCWTRDSNGTWGFWEVYSGCSNATEAFISPASGGGVAGPPVDKIPSRWANLPVFDVFKVECRRLIWSLLVVFAPLWLHTAPPCTFWSTLSRRNNKRTYSENERLRLEALVHLIFSVQLCQYQRSRGRYCSFEQPVRAASWNLDIVQDMLHSRSIAISPATGGMQLRPMREFGFDNCRWGQVDPGNGRPYKKAQRFACNADMSTLCLRCQGGHVHQIVENVVAGGPRHGTRRSVVAGEYPMEFCMAWAKVIKSCRPLAV